MSEPVAYQQRTRPNWKDETCWTPWEDCSKTEAEDCWNRPQVLDWLYEARALYTTPQQRKPLTDEQAEKLCNVGPVYAPDGVVTRTPSAYRVELMKAALLGLRKGETAHGIKGASL